MKIHISVFGRFHAFEIAHELVQLGHQVVVSTGYPTWWIRKRYSKEIKLDTHPFLGLTSKLLERYFPKSRRRLEFFFSDQFDRIVSRGVASDTDLFIGWSGNSLKTIRAYADSKARVCLVRGSAHIAWEKKHIPGLQTPNSVIAKEEEEYAHAEFINVPSEFARSTFPDWLQPRVKAIPLGVDSSFFYCYNEARLPGPIRFCFIGMMTKRKGVDVLLNSFNVMRRVCECTLTLVGQSCELSIPSNDTHILFKGTQSKSQIRDILNQSDVLILPSRADGWGMVVTEALSCGTKVICSDAVGASELVQQSPIFGKVIRSNSETDLIAAMTAAQPEERLARLSRAQLLTKKTSWTIHAQEILLAMSHLQDSFKT
jgi:glycosyltransferase involved in cell wall biosynthesis